MYGHRRAVGEFLQFDLFLQSGRHALHLPDHLQRDVVHPHHLQHRGKVLRERLVGRHILPDPTWNRLQAIVKLLLLKRRQ